MKILCVTAACGSKERMAGYVGGADGVEPGAGKRGPKRMAGYLIHSGMAGQAVSPREISLSPERASGAIIRVHGLCRMGGML